MSEITTSAAEYMSAVPRFSALEVVDLGREAAAVTGLFRNQVMSQVNGHCLRLGVLDGQYPWHFHPGSDELFLVLDGRLVIELEDGRALTIDRHQSVTIPAGVVHRTRGEGRTVNLCVEAVAAETVFVDGPAPR